jgi:hypothetical protein
MAPLTWKNVAPVDTSNALEAFLKAGKQIGTSIGGIGESITGYVDTQQEDTKNKMMMEMLQAGNNEAAQNSIINKYAGHAFAPEADTMFDVRADAQKTALEQERLKIAQQNANTSLINANVAKQAADQEQAGRQTFQDISASFTPQTPSAPVEGGGPNTLFDTALRGQQFSGMHSSNLTSTQQAELSSKFDRGISAKANTLLEGIDYRNPASIAKVRSDATRAFSELAKETSTKYANEQRDAFLNQVDTHVENADTFHKAQGAQVQRTVMQTFANDPTALTLENLTKAGEDFAEYDLDSDLLDKYRIVETLNSTETLSPEVLGKLTADEANRLVVKQARATLNRYPNMSVSNTTQLIKDVAEISGLTLTQDQITASNEELAKENKAAVERERKAKEAAAKVGQQAWAASAKSSLKTLFGEDVVDSTVVEFNDAVREAFKGQGLTSADKSKAVQAIINAGDISGGSGSRDWGFMDREFDMTLDNERKAIDDHNVEDLRAFIKKALGK